MPITMSDKTYSFDLPPQQKSIIKVIGVGGGGSNAVNHMYNQGIKDVEFFVCNTDIQALQSSPVPSKIQIGSNLTEGLGAGANPEKGKAAAIESKEEIRDVLSEDTRMLFITAGMGGGTGTGAAPEIAKVAKELGILTVGIVTQPFGFEGRKKIRLADQGLAELRENCDTVLVILNDKLREVYSNLSLSNAFAQADNVLSTAAKSIAEIITLPGYINVDFEDVKTVMANSGAAVMGSARAEGDQRSRRAAEMALSSPLLDNVNIRGAQKILLSIKSGDKKEIQMEELDEITSFIHDECGQDAEMIFGHGMDEELEESVMVTVIATGFKGAQETDYPEKEEAIAPPAPPQEVKRVVDLESNRQVRQEPVQPPVTRVHPGYSGPSHVVPAPVQRNVVPPNPRPQPEPVRPPAPDPYQREQPPADQESYHPLRPQPEPPAEERPSQPHHDEPRAPRPEPPVRRWNLEDEEDTPTDHPPRREYRWDNTAPEETEHPSSPPRHTWDLENDRAHQAPSSSESAHDESSPDNPADDELSPGKSLPGKSLPGEASPGSSSPEELRGRWSAKNEPTSPRYERPEEVSEPRRYEEHESAEQMPPSAGGHQRSEEEQQLFQREISYKKKLLIEEAYARKMKMRGRKSISSPDSSQEQFQKENFNEPAYMRKNVHLYSTPPSNDQNVSRYSLDDENNIVGNNRFLHDNVD